MTLTNSQESPETTALREGVESSEGIRRLGRLAGIESLTRNLENEDSAADRDARMNDAEVYGKDAMNAVKPPEGEEMRITAARDVHVHQPPPPELPPVQQPNSKSHAILKGAAVATALMIGIGGGASAVAIPWLLGMLDKTPPPVVAPPADEWTDRVLENYVPPMGGDG